MFPAICGRCGREFSGKRLRELTVHHKDHNHDNNPPDGSNWELLCLFCHDNEHSRGLNSEHYGELEPSENRNPTTTFKPFAGLEALLKKDKNDSIGEPEITFENQHSFELTSLSGHAW